MAARRTLLITLCLLLTAAAPAFERLDDAAHDAALERHARRVAAIEREILALVAIAPVTERFELYRTYNRLVGTWVQVDTLHALLDRAVTAVSLPDDIALRNGVADQAQFVLGELDEAEADHLPSGIIAPRPDHARIDSEIRTLLGEIRTTVAAMLAGECARTGCTAPREDSSLH